MIFVSVKNYDYTYVLKHEKPARGQTTRLVLQRFSPVDSPKSPSSLSCSEAVFPN